MKDAQEERLVNKSIASLNSKCADIGNLVLCHFRTLSLKHSTFNIALQFPVAAARYASPNYYAAFVAVNY